MLLHQRLRLQRLLCRGCQIYLPIYSFSILVLLRTYPSCCSSRLCSWAISGGEPIKTGLESSKLAIGAFIIPYMFVFSPELLMIDTTWYSPIWIVFTAFTGMVAIGAGVVGHWYRKIFWYERMLAGCSRLATDLSRRNYRYRWTCNYLRV